MPRPIPYILEFHVCKQARDLYQFDQSIYSYNGNVVFIDFHAARVFAERMNSKRDLIKHPELAVRAGQIHAMALIDEILHMMIEEYRQQINPHLMQQAASFIISELGTEKFERTLELFCREFPPVTVYRGEQSVEDYLVGNSLRPDGRLVENRLLVLEELLMLWLANLNPAYAPYSELFNDSILKQKSAYSAIIDQLNAFFRDQPQASPTSPSLIDLLRSPANYAPDSLTAQLEFIQKRWGGFRENLVQRMLSSLDFVREEEKPVFSFGGPGPVEVYEYLDILSEPEQFSPDRDWMPNLVLIAKNSYVWLDQLSKKYGRFISQLDQVPEAELEEMARWGITGLWLIGLWERSMASQRIKQLRGNPEAAASAYSLFSYDIAADLGGETAYLNLREKARKYGIRLASDMVPNHMGIDSRWVVEHPDWFISLDYSPFPSYTFNGPNLSWDERVGIYLEDHYYDNSDAAVVFKRVDHWTGSEKYVYHGNDGTSMPWNDTAQLNYLLPEVREAVIQTILHVARKFPIIRFDAAMTLAKKHYQRLWYPEPGSGGDIPSRAEFGMTRMAFDEVFPTEFWREVVDRVAEEVPDTLLLAEAFWLMEGYFVRSLGMHRVYNSAFMNMLRDEKNQEYRLVIKNTIEFDPEILKRYVNFMNNPDERTTVDQFGKGDKYFGICSMMATMPGLPMFGHGQVEGFTEKYGMEYRKAYWDEAVDDTLVERHRRQIFPLLRKRYLFAEVERFRLFDFEDAAGKVNEDVFAYSNQVGEEKALIIYQNRYASSSGWIKNSMGNLVKGKSEGENQELEFSSFGETFDLHNQPGYFTVFRDHVSQLVYLRNSQELCQYGLYLEMKAYSCHVFLDFHEVEETEDNHYSKLAAYLQGGGVHDLQEALAEYLAQPIQRPIRELINPGMLGWLIDHRLAQEATTRYQETLNETLQELDEKVEKIIAAIEDFTGFGSVSLDLVQSIHERVLAILEILGSRQDESESEVFAYLFAQPLDGKEEAATLLEKGAPQVWDVLLSWAVLSLLGRTAGAQNFSKQSRSWLDEWALGRLIADAFYQHNMDEADAKRQKLLVKILTDQSDWCLELFHEEAELHLLEKWMSDPDIQKYLMVHTYQDIHLFNREAFETFVWWLLMIAAVTFTVGQFEIVNEEETAGTETESITPDKNRVVDLTACYRIVSRLLLLMQKSEYQVEKLLEEAREV